MGQPLMRAWSGIEVAGAVAPAFANTLDWRLRATPVELLTDYAELLRWAWSAGALTRDEAEALQAWREAHPRAAAAALARAVELREAIAVLFAARVGGSPLPPSALVRLEGSCLAAWGARRLAAADGAPTWTWRARVPDPERPAWAAALDAERLLVAGAGQRLRQCGDAECGWFFLDTSRNGSRRWCSMEACGNRNKARRFARRRGER